MRIGKSILGLVFGLLLAGCGARPFFDATGAVLLITAPSFATTFVGGTPSTTLTVSNVGKRPALHLSASGLSSPFQFKGGSYPGTGGTCTDQLAAGATCTIEVSVYSVTPQTLTSNLTLYYGDDRGNRSASQTFQAQFTVAALNRATSFNGGVRASVLANDGSGKYYLGGAFTSFNSVPLMRIARFNSDGTLDASFSIGTGFAGNVEALAMALDGSGSIYVGGTLTSYNGTPVGGLVRLTSTGALDATFDNTNAYIGQVLTIAPTTDGTHRVYAAGVGALRVRRLTSAGAVDASFVTGSNFTFFGSATTAIYCVLVAPDGSNDIYVSGLFDTYNGTAAYQLVRIQENGNVTAIIPAAGITGFTKMFPADDGSNNVYLAGTGSYGGAATSGLIRITNTGVLDKDFGLSFGQPAFSLAGDGSHDFYFSQASGLLARYNSDGTIDSSFSSVICDNINTLSSPSDGSVLAGGTFQTCAGGKKNRFAKFTPSGVLEGGSDASTHTGFSSVNALVRTLGDEGYLYVGANSTASQTAIYDGVEFPSLIRLKLDGTVDPAFAVGTGFQSSGGPGSVESLLLTSVGTPRLYVGGSFTTYQGTSAGNIVRLNSDGSLDSTFSTGVGFNNGIYTLAATNDGSGAIYVSGSATSYQGTPIGGAGDGFLIRLLPDGTIDPAFSTARRFHAPSGTGIVSSIVATNDGVYASGNFTTVNGVAKSGVVRLTNAGAIDAGFNVGSGFNSVASGPRLAALNDGTGRIYAVGDYTTYQGASARRIARLNSDGTLDSTFNVGTAFNNSTTAIALDDRGDGGLYVASQATQYNGTTVNYVIRLRGDGSLDSSFVGAAGGVPDILQLAGDGTGDLYLGTHGYGVPPFGSWGGATTDALVRVNAQGQLY